MSGGESAVGDGVCQRSVGGESPRGEVEGPPSVDEAKRKRHAFWVEI